MTWIPASLLIALAVQLFAQFIKMIVHSIRDRKFDISYFFSYGGMPSAHTAFVTALIVSVGFQAGIGSEVFAVALVFGIITMYDAVKLRGAVQKQAVITNRLLKKVSPEETERLPEMIGHSTWEIIVGVLYAIAVAVPLNLLAGMLLL